MSSVTLDWVAGMFQRYLYPTGFDLENLFETLGIVSRHYPSPQVLQQLRLSEVNTSGYSNTPFLDNGFVMLQENQRLVSPISVVYYEYYKEQKRTESSTLEQHEASKIQCIVENTVASKLKFGQAQFPGLGDYADQIDTLNFLTELA